MSYDLLQVEIAGGTGLLVLLIGGLWWWLHRKHDQTQGAIEGVRVQISDNADRAEFHDEKRVKRDKKFQSGFFRHVVEFLKSVANLKEPK